MKFYYCLKLKGNKSIPPPLFPTPSPQNGVKEMS